MYKSKYYRARQKYFDSHSYLQWESIVDDEHHSRIANLNGFMHAYLELICPNSNLNLIWTVPKILSHEQQISHNIKKEMIDDVNDEDDEKKSFEDDNCDSDN